MARSAGVVTGEIAEPVAAERGEADLLGAEFFFAVPVGIPDVGLVADVGEGMALQQGDGVPLAVAAMFEEREVRDRLAEADAVVADRQPKVDLQAVVEIRLGRSLARVALPEAVQANQDIA